MSAPAAPGTRPAPRPAPRSAPPASVVAAAAYRETADVLTDLGVGVTGLTTAEATARSARFGPNAVASHRARAGVVLWHQVRSPLLALLVAAAAASFFVGQRSDALIIGAIVVLSVGLGFLNEYKAERAAEALHSQIRHQSVVLRDGRPATVDVTALVPGDVIELRLGAIVPADVRLIETTELECDESLLTGESLPAEKDTAPVPPGTPLAELGCAALMGSIVHAGTGRAVVVATGARTEFGAIAAGLSEHQLDTAFQSGLRRFSMLLVYVAAVLTTGIFVFNVALSKPVIDALLFSLAIAVGITPQLLPAVVSTSLAAGSRQMSRRKVLVKRLVCIEDLGDVDTLFTDKTGTLTEGSVRFMRALPTQGTSAEELLRYGLLCTDDDLPDAAGPSTAGGNALDAALRVSPAVASQTEAVRASSRLAVLPFDHERRMTSVRVRSASGPATLITKGAPESVLSRCPDVAARDRHVLDAEFAAGHRVVAVATSDSPPSPDLSTADEQGLRLAGFLVFLDPPKRGASAALRRLADLGIRVRVVTGDNPVVAARVCADLGLPPGRLLTGADLDALDDQELAQAIPETTVFARVSPAHKARIVRVQRQTGGDVAFLGDGVNDALALHAADVGVSVDSASDVAKDAADIILLEKDLAVLADGVEEGRRIFANTIKYVLMGTSSNFGNMFSAAGASLFLPFLPMLPSQILLNNLLYDTSQLTIPTDTVDAEQLRRPAHWDLGFIRRFMLVFGPISSLFDFATFAIMIWLLGAGATEFRTGWFVESLATQTFVIFAIRTRRTPFWHSHPSLPLVLSTTLVVTVSVILPFTPLASVLGFRPLPGRFFAVLAALVLAYLGLVEIAKRAFYRAAAVSAPTGRSVAAPRPHRYLRRRVSHFSSVEPAPHDHTERVQT